MSSHETNADGEARKWPRQEHPSAYVVQDRSNLDEMHRLAIQDEMFTAQMGGVLSEQPAPGKLQSILDVACGTGRWLVAVAKAYPNIKQLVGVDISGRMIENAQAYASAEGVSDRVSFQTGDALRRLDFPTNHFDLVNQRMAAGFMRGWEWPRVLHEFQRVTRGGGVVRLTEGHIQIEESSAAPALLQFLRLLREALTQRGHQPEVDSNGPAQILPSLLDQYGIQDVQETKYPVEYRAGTAAGEAYAEDVRLAMRTLQPFLKKWTTLPDNYDELCQQVLSDLTQPDFFIRFTLVTIWGTVRHLSWKSGNARD